jgi:hypothetical protein
MCGVSAGSILVRGFCVQEPIFAADDQQWMHDGQSGEIMPPDWSRETCLEGVGRISSVKSASRSEAVAVLVLFFVAFVKLLGKIIFDTHFVNGVQLTF